MWLTMLKRGNLLKLMAALSALLALMIAVPVAHGGRWSGTDPEAYVNGEKINVYIEWPTEHNCDVGNIDITILVPVLGDVEFVGESEDRFRCPEGGKPNTVKTHTYLQEGQVETVNVIGLLESNSLSASLDGDSLLEVDGELNEFQVNMYVYKNDELVTKCTGLSNAPVECRPTLTSQVSLLNGLF